MRESKTREIVGLFCGAAAWAVILFALFSRCAVGIARGEDESPTLLAFHATWCGPCRQMEPVVAEIEREGFRVRHVDIDQDRDLTIRYRVRAVPTFVIVERDREVDRIVGGTTLERLKIKLHREAKPAKAEKPEKEKSGRERRPTPAWRYAEAVGHRAAVVRVYCQDGARTRSIGSGVLVRWGGRVVVLTARHVVQDAKKITVELFTKKTHYARVLKVDATWDCAVLELIGEPQGVTPDDVERGEAAMQVAGNRLESCGYGPDGKLAVNDGLFVSYRRTTAAKVGTDDWFEISGHARQGDSGGPIFNERGRVVGVLWGTNGEVVVGVQAGRLHVLLDAAVPPVKRAYWPTAWNPGQRNPTPAKPAIPFDALPPAESYPLPGPATEIEQTAGQDGGAVLKWRREQEAKDEATKQKLDAIAAQLESLARTPTAPSPTVPLPPAAEEKKPETLKEKIQDKLEGQSGFLGKFWKALDNENHIWVIIGVVGLVILWKKLGGIHTVIEKHREQLEKDAAGGGLKGKLATDILSVHDGPLGQKLADFEAKLNNVHAKAEAAHAAAATVAGQVAQVALAATPAAPIVAAANAANAVKTAAAA